MAKKETYATKDTWLASYLLVKGGVFEGIDKDINPGKTTFVFINGGEINAWIDEYNSGRAVVNLMFFKAANTHLRDLLKREYNLAKAVG